MKKGRITKRTVIPKHASKHISIKRGKLKSSLQSKRYGGQAPPYVPIQVPTIDKPLELGGMGCDKKIAFIFLTLESLHQGQIWWKFLKDGGNKCNVYAHSKYPQLIKQHFLRIAQIGANVRTRWADISLVRATNNLIREALRDPTNAYIVLVSEKCIPLYKFDTVYDYICGHDKSHVFHYAWGGKPWQNEQRYTSLINQERSKAVPKNMGLNLKLHQFLKQSQWMLLRRDHAQHVTNFNYTPLFNKMAAPDEHYYINVLRSQIPLFDTQNINYPLTFVNWKDSHQGNHPIEYDTVNLPDIRKKFSPEFFRTEGFQNTRDQGFKSMFMRKVNHKSKIIKK